MSVTEEKGQGTIYRFSYGYVDKNQELTWVPNVVTARRNGEKWNYEYAAVKNQDVNQFETFRKMLEKVTQVTETNAMNLMGITVEKNKPAESAKA